MVAGVGPFDPATISTAALMALEGEARRAGREAATLAERPGATATRRRGQGHEIREIRPFVQGDDPRHIDAAATARTGSPHVRSFHEDRERTLMLIADFRSPMLWGTVGCLRSVAAARAVVTAGWQAALQGGSVGLVVLTDAGPEVEAPHPRHRGMALVSGRLARTHAAALDAARKTGRSGQQTRALAPDLLCAARQLPRGAGIVLATGLDDPGDAWDAALAPLCARGPLRLILIEDRFETDPPRRALPWTGAGAGTSGQSHGDFTAIANLRAQRADRLAHLPGVQVMRLSSGSRIAAEGGVA